MIAAVLGCAWMLGAACTLTSDEFEPPIVGNGPLLPVSGEPGASACEGRAQCCTAVACPSGETCVDGSCLAAADGDSSDAGAPDCVGADCPGGMFPLPLDPSCEDGVQNGDETGADCGGRCSGCGVEGGCASDADCDAGLICSALAQRCTALSCSDEVQNGAETSTDCGGDECPGCVDGATCNNGSDCQSRICSDDGACLAPSCEDGVQNGGEPGTDCGGPCPQDCGNGEGCAGSDDCQSGVCGSDGCDGADALCCQAPSCADGVQNGDEIDTDCGIAGCARCSLGDVCTTSLQCDTTLCRGGECVNPPACDDAIQNGTESDIDCGGSCERCGDTSDCNADADCASNNCDPGGTCISCVDNLRNGSETGVDCGGADTFCRRCNAGEVCSGNPDCVNQFCLAGVCT